MKLGRFFSWALALGLCTVGVSPARAGWHNVFQVCCHSCGKTGVSYYAAPAVSYYAPPADPCCTPCQVCTTRYVQRCFYQPQVSYETRSYYEPVTTYRTSYYYEPVTSYRYSSYYDPCTCTSYQVACPTTSYQLRSQCCPVQSWVQRCYYQAVTSYRQCSYWEPVTTCTTPVNPCAPAVAAPAPVPAAPAPLPAAPVTGEPPMAPGAAPQPGVGESRQPPPAGVRESRDRGTGGSGSPLYDQYYPPSNTPAMPPASGSSLRPQALPVMPPAATPAQNPPKVKLEQIVSAPGGAGGVRLASATGAPQWTPKQ
jgi:hypothetical protein